MCVNTATKSICPRTKRLSSSNHSSAPAGSGGAGDGVPGGMVPMLPIVPVVPVPVAGPSRRTVPASCWATCASSCARRRLPALSPGRHCPPPNTTSRPTVYAKALMERAESAAFREVSISAGKASGSPHLRRRFDVHCLITSSGLIAWSPRGLLRSSSAMVRWVVKVLNVARDRCNNYPSEWYAPEGN